MHSIYLDLQMRAMSSRIHYDDGTRALKKLATASLRKAGMELRKLSSIRENVLIVHTNAGKFLLKGFSSNKNLNSQKKLTRQLHANGFTKTYRFMEELEPFVYDDYVFAWIEFLSSYRKKFSFSTRASRQEGLLLLEDFHDKTREFYKDIPVKRFDQVAKWKERFEEFEGNISTVKKFVSRDVIQTWLKWGKRSLKGLQRHEGDLYKEPLCVVHGDVAHHNFFYKDDGSLYLIDFDLISIAPPLIDYLQYSNRIMPVISSSSELWSYEQLEQYKNNQAFLYALLFPTDIFREWNRLIRENDFRNNNYLRSVWSLTVEEMPKRVKMYKEISELL